MTFQKKKAFFREFLFLLLLILISILLSLPVIERFTTNEDEGISLYGAIRILNGQVPYRDFWHITLPGAVWLIAGAFRLFSPELLTVRVLTAFIFVIVSMIIYLTGRKLTEKALYPFLAALFVLLFNFIPSINLTPHKPAVLFALLGFYLAQKGMFLSAGLSISASTFFQQNTGLLSAAGVIFYMLSVRFVESKISSSTEAVNKSKIHPAAFFIAGYLLPLAGFFVYLIYTGSFKEAFYTLAIWPFGGYTAFNRYPYFNCELQILKNTVIFKGNLLQIISNLSGLASLSLIGYLPFIIFPSSLYYSIKNKDKTLYLLTICGFFLFLSSFTRPDLLHIIYTLPVFFLLFFYTIHILKKTEENISRGMLFNILRIILILLSVMSFFERATGFLNVLRTPHEIILTERGKVKLPYYNAQIINPLIDFVYSNTSKKDKIFIYHWSPALYFYLNRDNPAQFDTYKPVYNSKEKIINILNTLKQNPPELIIKDDYIERILNPSHPRSLFCTFPEVQREKLMNDPVDEYVMENGILLQTIGQFKIYKLRPQ